MRKLVAIEGISTIDGRFIVPGALEPADRAYIPVTQLGDITPIGNATDFQRNKQPEGGYGISFEMHFRDDVNLEEVEDYSATIFLTPLESETGRMGKLIIKRAIIREVILVSSGYWPWRVR